MAGSTGVACRQDQPEPSKWIIQIGIAFKLTFTKRPLFHEVNSALILKPLAVTTNRSLALCGRCSRRIASDHPFWITVCLRSPMRCSAARLRLFPALASGPTAFRGSSAKGVWGWVYLAEREDIEMLVAIKLLRDSTLSPIRRDALLASPRPWLNLTIPSLPASLTPEQRLTALPGSLWSMSMESRSRNIAARTKAHRRTAPPFSFCLRSRAVCSRANLHSSRHQAVQRSGEGGWRREAARFRHRQTPGQSRRTSRSDPNSTACDDRRLCLSRAASGRPSGGSKS